MRDSRKQADPSSPSPASPTSSSPLPSSTTQETFKKTMERWDSIASQFSLPLSSEMQGLPPPVFQPFPTVDELVAAPPESARREVGLFEGVLGDRAEAIYVDVLEHPEKYEEGLREVAHDLVVRNRKPRDDERAMLDRAVLDFMATPRPKAERPKPPPPKKLDVRDLPREDAGGSTDNDGGAGHGSGRDVVPTDETDRPAFWWL